MRATEGRAGDVKDRPLGRRSYDQAGALGAKTTWPVGARLLFIVAAALLCWAIPVAIYFLL